MKLPTPPAVIQIHNQGGEICTLDEFLEPVDRVEDIRFHRGGNTGIDCGVPRFRSPKRRRVPVGRKRIVYRRDSCATHRLIARTHEDPLPGTRRGAPDYTKDPKDTRYNNDERLRTRGTEQNRAEPQSSQLFHEILPESCALNV